MDAAFTLPLSPFSNSFTGAKYILGNPGRLGDVDEEEKRRLQEIRRRQRQEADVMEAENGLSPIAEEQGQGFMGSLWAIDDEDDKC